MGESYMRPGVQCDVGTIEKAGGDTWKAFCDCNFLEPIVVDRYYIDNIPVVIPPTITSDAARKQFVDNLLKNTPNLPQRLRVERGVTALRQTDEWHKCMAKQCLLITGCWNASKNGWDPFNAHPGMLAAPWTEFGAAARGIYKKDAGFWYDVGSFTSISLADYSPLSLWQTYWLNPAKYGLLMLKLALFVPGGVGVAAAVNAAGPGAPPWALIPLASAEVAARRLDYKKAVLEPMLTGTVKNIGSAIKYLGKCGIGVNVPCGVGLIVQRAAQDQIDSGEINKIHTPAIRGIIAFLAKSGDALVEQVMKATTGALDGGVFAVLESGFSAAADVVQANDPGAADVLRLMAKAAGVGTIIASGIVQKRDVLLIADDVADKLLGFRPSVYFELLKTSTSNALAYVRAAQQTQGTNFEKSKALIEAVGKALNDIATAIDTLSRAIGGGLEDLSRTFSNAAGAISGAQRTSVDVQNQVIATAKQAASQPSQPPSQSRPPKSQSPVQPPAQPPFTPAKKSSMNYIPVAVGTVGGALVAGPLGAIAGASVGTAIGALVDKKPAPPASPTPPASPAPVTQPGSVNVKEQVPVIGRAVPPAVAAQIAAIQQGNAHRQLARFAGFGLKPELNKSTTSSPTLTAHTSPTTRVVAFPLRREPPVVVLTSRGPALVRPGLPAEPPTKSTPINPATPVAPSTDAPSTSVTPSADAPPSTPPASTTGRTATSGAGTMLGLGIASVVTVLMLRRKEAR